MQNYMINARTQFEPTDPSAAATLWRIESLRNPDYAVEHRVSVPGMVLRTLAAGVILYAATVGLTGCKSAPIKANQPTGIAVLNGSGGGYIPVSGPPDDSGGTSGGLPPPELAFQYSLAAAQPLADLLGLETNFNYGARTDINPETSRVNIGWEFGDELPKGLNLEFLTLLGDVGIQRGAPLLYARMLSDLENIGGTVAVGYRTRTGNKNSTIWGGGIGYSAQDLKKTHDWFNAWAEVYGIGKIGGIDLDGRITHANVLGDREGINRAYEVPSDFVQGLLGFRANDVAGQGSQGRLWAGATHFYGPGDEETCFTSIGELNLPIKVLLNGQYRDTNFDRWRASIQLTEFAQWMGTLLESLDFGPTRIRTVKSRIITPGEETPPGDIPGDIPDPGYPDPRP
jgi:hypothetical protein